MAASKSASARSKTSRKHRQPKVHSRPSAADFWAAARRLDALNGIAPKRRASFLHLSIEREQSKDQQAERCIIEHSQTKRRQQRWIPSSMKTNRRRPLIEDSGDEGSLAACYQQSEINNRHGMQNIYQLNINPTPERMVPSEDCSNGINDSNYNKTKFIDPVSDEDDLTIDMHGWDTQLHPGPSSQEQNPRYFTRGQRSRASSSRPQQLPITSPPPNHERVRGAQHSRSLADRQPNTIPKTLYSGNVKDARFSRAMTNERIRCITRYETHSMGFIGAAISRCRALRVRTRDGNVRSYVRDVDIRSEDTIWLGWDVRVEEVYAKVNED